MPPLWANALEPTNGWLGLMGCPAISPTSEAISVRRVRDSMGMQRYPIFAWSPPITDTCRQEIEHNMIEVLGAVYMLGLPA